MHLPNKEGSIRKILGFLSFRRKSGDDDVDGDETTTLQIKEGERKLKELIDPAQNHTVDEILNRVTVENLCSCQDPIHMAFKVNCTLQQFAKNYTENTALLNKLADQTEDFAVKLIDQVNSKEQLVIRDEPKNIDRYASLLSYMTDDAITHSQKKFVSHPLLYKRLKMRWKLGLPEALKRHSILNSVFVFLLILFDTALTPFLLPIIGVAFFMDQRKYRRRLTKAKKQKTARRRPSVPENNAVTVEEENEYSGTTSAKPDTTAKSSWNVFDKYFGYCMCPFVIFVKEKLSQLIFIGLHCCVCIFPSSVIPTSYEYLIFVFACGMVLSECQQYRTSLSTEYFKDVWNYVDLIVLIVYLVIVILRITTIIRGGDPYQNRLLEFVNYCYGINTLFLILRFSSILELSSVVGPLQLALFRMCVDLLIILMQFCFVIVAFSLAIAMSQKAEISYATPPNNMFGEYEDENFMQDTLKTSGNLLWSVFDLTEWEHMALPNDNMPSVFVKVLYCLFLIFSVIMLINMLVALLTKTYDNITTNAEVEWKFSLAVLETQCRKMHVVAVPFNLLAEPARFFCLGRGSDAREEMANNRQKLYKRYYQECLFPVITQRYKEKYGESFPLSLEEKVDLIMQKIKTI